MTNRSNSIALSPPLTLLELFVDMAAQPALLDVISAKNATQLYTFLQDASDDGIGKYTDGKALDQEAAASFAEAQNDPTGGDAFRTLLAHRTGLFIVEDNFNSVYQLVGTVEYHKPEPPTYFLDGTFEEAPDRFVPFTPNTESKTLSTVRVYHLDKLTAEREILNLPAEGGEHEYVERYLTGDISHLQVSSQEERNGQ